MNNMKVIGDKLKQIRIKRNLRQREVAKQLGITREEISYIERGVRNISLTRLEDLLKIYGLSLSSFFEDKEEIDTLKDIIY
jgi:HTH-type transcriptional repressor of puuD